MACRMLDYARLRDNLTISIARDEDRFLECRLAVYEKGHLAAESIIFSRYLMFQALYFHHTVRSIRAMLKAAVAEIPKPTQRALEGDTKRQIQIFLGLSASTPLEIFHQYCLQKGIWKWVGLNEFNKCTSEELDQIIDFLQISTSVRKDEKKKQKIKEFLSEEIQTKLAPDLNVTPEKMLVWIFHKTSKAGKKIIKKIRNRDYYKRIHTIHFKPGDKSRPKLLITLRRVSRKPSFSELVRKHLLEALRNYKAQQEPITTALSAKSKEKALLILAQPLSILCDFPKPVYGFDEKKEINIIAEPQRLQYDYSRMEEINQRISNVFNDMHFKLMEMTAKGRIFCHPKIRNVLRVALSNDIIQGCVEKALDEFEDSY